MVLGTTIIWGVVLVTMFAGNAVEKKPTVEYLSDLQARFALLKQGWGELGIDVSAHAPGQTPLPLRIKDKDYSRGLGHHAPGEIVVELDGEYLTFEAEVGVQWQTEDVGSVVFQVFVDGQKKFDSGVMREADPARPVRLSLAGARELRLVATDAGDGFICDCADWADARLTRDPSAVPKVAEPLDVARFARVVTWDPNRTDGCRANRVQEFRAEDLFLESDVRPDSRGNCTVPRAENGLGCIGLQWLERRRIKELALEFADGASVPSVDGAQVQCWVGESAWQGNWKPLSGTVEQHESRWTFKVEWIDNPELGPGTRKIRWIFPASEQPIVLRKVCAFTDSRWTTGELLIQTEKPMPGKRGEIEVYNGEMIEPAGSGGSLRCAWDLKGQLRLKLRYSGSRAWKSDRTVLRFRLPTGAFGVAVDDVLAHDCVYVRDLGIFVSRVPAKSSLADYRKKIAGQKTVLERVREMPDQTFAQALAKTHNPVQDNGPMMVSLACDNQKFVVERDGRVSFEQFEMVPKFGAGKNEKLTRHLDGGWLPVPVTTVEEDGALYRQRTFVAPYDRESPPQALSWLNRKPLCVSEFTIENAQPRPVNASLLLSFLSENGVEVRQVPQGAVVEKQGRLMAFVDTSEAISMKALVQDGSLALSGEIPAQSQVQCVAYLPAWEMKPDDYTQLKGGTGLLADVKAYWERVTAGAMQVELPDEMLMNVIRASQVHCLLAARSEEDGLRISPWIASMLYGPLESESNPIVRAMALMGHEEFARRSLDFFIARYNPAGFLTTGYTLMGTGWHLWTLGEFYELAQDSDWLKRGAPKVAQVCRWITDQREKTKKLDAWGNKVPEYGLMPPGVIADWNAFAYYFCLNGYYCAGLHSAAQALAEIGYPDAPSFVKSAAEFREDILRAYRWTQSRMPVYPLRNGAWVPGYPAQVHSPGPTNDYFPGEDGNRSWAYDVEAGAHQLAPQGILDANGRDVAWIMDHQEDVQFLAEGWFDYPAEASERDWFNLGGFSKVQPYYTRNAEIYAMRDDVKPFIRSYFNSLASLLSTENLSLWEHFANQGAYNKTHETGYFLQQTRSMLVMERGEDLWLAPLVTNNWLKDGMSIVVRDAPTRFGKVGYRITSSAKRGFIQAEIEPPIRSLPRELVIRLRHPEGRPIRAVTVNGKPHREFDPHKDCIRIKPTTKKLIVRAEY